MKEGEPVEVKVMLSPVAHALIVAMAAFYGSKSIEDFTREQLESSVVMFTASHSIEQDLHKTFADPRKGEA